MIPSRALKVYKTISNAEFYVTTVFTPYDATILMERLLKEAGVMQVRLRSVKGRTLLTDTRSRKGPRYAR